MEIDVALVRCAMTKPEMQGKYIGVSDEPLCGQGREALRAQKQAGRYPPVERLFTAPPLRCRETASLIYPGLPAVVEERLSPFNYGAFEGMSCDEIEADPRFLQWASAEEPEGFPEGESPFRQAYRNVAAFRAIMSECEENGVFSAAIVADRLAVQAIIRRYLAPRSAYREFAPDFGGGALIRYNCYRRLGSLVNFF